MREGLTFGKQHKFRLSDLVPSKIPGGASASKPLQAGKSALGIEYLAILSTKNDASSAVAEPDPDSPGKELWEERKFSCHLISPVGQVIKDFKNVKQLLESLRDAIRAHRLSTSRQGGSAASGARYLTGTIQFMAVEVLQKVDHTYRHDVESLFSLLLWLCGREAWDPVQGLAVEGETHCKERPFRKWHVDKLQDIAELKQGQMGGLETLDNLMREFPKALDVAEPLCEELGESFFSQMAKGKAMELFGTTQVILTIP
ncbi:hypothetical protein E4U47_002109 [Claviceps purpurea]|nr:hypothetical protein E4U47_002109 [Claviceps purpurea]